ncbi:hypothetical protein RhiirA4_470236 [Rhizophagus irregularis]|uniref:Uncharacterized protein n=1 Tax=Rhizophagus irregularis TaxID=588596 RepID=A0A2I1H0Z3_9GLOM|nr:hypothetical protein RhiirA4_470236 [Rhizophagus irregularis]
MTSHIDVSQIIINLKLSPFILCSYFRFLLGYSEMNIPEQFLAVSLSPLQVSSSTTHIYENPISDPCPAFALRSDTKFHIVGTTHKIDSSNTYLVCAWVQTLDDFILDSGVFSCPMVSPYNDVAELTFVLYVLNSLPLASSVEFLSFLQLDVSYSSWLNASPIKRVRLKNNLLWSCISELLRAKHISCRFLGMSKDDPNSLFIERAQNLLKVQNWPNLLHPVSLMDDIFPSTLNTMGLFNGRFFSLFGLSRFSALQTSYHSIDWSLTFDTFTHSLYPRLLVSKASTFLQFRLKLWFDELPIMSRLQQRFLGLYADDSLCPNCGTFMETLEHLFICSPNSLDADVSNPELLQHKDITVVDTPPIGY